MSTSHRLNLIRVALTGGKDEGLTRALVAALVDEVYAVPENCRQAEAGPEFPDGFTAESGRRWVYIHDPEPDVGSGPEPIWRRDVDGQKLPGTLGKSGVDEWDASNPPVVGWQWGEPPDKNLEYDAKRGTYYGTVSHNGHSWQWDGLSVDGAEDWPTWPDGAEWKLKGST